ncbi:hypothetical protein BEE62_03685 [Marinobacter nauticus]|uniref:Uncharacterized protein n=2 Tax=Marinobacter nauticus TaxID=2743 RepID=A0A1M2UVG7_MARNT|nr:hypothetical protein BEE62_03685 [Marinobacter nauticus]
MILTAAFIISGCSGGSSGGSPIGESPETPPDDSATVSGTAAAGAPLVGFVGAKDASDNTATADINAAGSYELDLSELTTPVLIYASGIAGGNAYQLLSIVFEDDLDGTVNITPLTDLIVANAGGRTPQEIFNNPDFSQLSQEAIQDQEEALKARLKPLLDGLGVDEDFDLRNSAFAADRSGFDAVLDVIEIMVDTGTNSATIRDRISNQTINNSFTQPSADTTPIEVDQTTLSEGVSAVQALNTLLSGVATALENANGDALQALVTDDFLNNGESAADFQARLIDTDSDASREDAIELALDFRNWSLAELTESGANVSIGAPHGPLEVVNDNGEWKLKGNNLEYFVFVEPTHLIENGATEPAVAAIGTMVYASNPTAGLGEIADSSVTVSGDLTVFNGNLPEAGDRFGRFEILGPNDIPSPAEVSFTWSNSTTGVVDSPASFTLRRGSPDFTNGAPEVTSANADLGANEYTFAWTLPPGYESVSVRNNFTGQQSGGVGESEDPGFVGNALANEARTYTGALPEGYVPSISDELRLIARDQFGVFVAARVSNPFADQVPPPMAEDALIGSWIARNPDNGNSPWVQLTFLESGYYMHQELDLPYRPDGDDAGFTGLELGQYTWNNETGELTVSDIIIDDNGFWGLTDVASGEERVALQVEGDTLTAFNPEIGPSESTEFTRVPLNESGITGSWLIQDPNNPANISVVTLLDDGFYFVGTSEPEDATGSPGLEFGTYTYDNESLVLEANTIFDQNGEYGLSDPRQGFDYATVIDGALVIDDGEAFQLSEIAPGVPASDGELTVDYAAPDDSPEVSGNFHYLRNFSAIEGELPNEPPYVWQTTENHAGADLSDNGDGTLLLSWAEICFGDLVVGASTSQGDALLEFANECIPDSSGSIEGITENSTGLSISLPEELVTLDDNKIQRSAALLEMIAIDSERSLFIGQSVRDFGYEYNTGAFSDGVEVNTHILSEKTTGRTVAELQGNWGLVVRRLTEVADDSDVTVPNELEYSASSLVFEVNADGEVTRVSEQDRGAIQGLTAGQSFADFEKAAEDLATQALGPFTVSDDGALGFLSGEFGGVLSANADVMFLALMNPVDPSANPGLVAENEWITGVRISDTFSATDLEGKAYTVISQSFWIEPERFEVDHLKPGATLSFPTGSGNTATLTRETTFAYVPFANNPTISREADQEETSSLEYTVDGNGRITMTSDFGEPGIVDFEVNGFATPDNRLLVLETTVVAEDEDGTTQIGGIGITYAICTNCD